MITVLPGYMDGYRMLLVDSPGEKTDKVTDTLSYELRDYGLALTPTTQRLAEFSSVENQSQSTQ